MKQNILVVDDQPGIRMLLEDVLTGEGYHVTARETGKEAIDELRRQSYDLVILDYKLPLMEGTKVVSQLEAEGIRIPAVLITGLVEEMDTDITNSTMVEAVVAKPFNIQHICSVVRTALE